MQTSFLVWWGIKLVSTYEWQAQVSFTKFSSATAESTAGCEIATTKKAALDEAYDLACPVRLVFEL